jgi:hypothetical protein
VTKAAIKWTSPSPPNAESHYDHVFGQTPFGKVVITWKSWKDYPAFTVDETPWGFMTGGNDLEETKRLVENEYNERLREALS